MKGLRLSGLRFKGGWGPRFRDLGFEAQGPGFQVAALKVPPSQIWLQGSHSDSMGKKLVIQKKPA